VTSSSSNAAPTYRQAEAIAAGAVALEVEGV
jgi:hypothetical protein